MRPTNLDICENKSRTLAQYTVTLPDSPVIRGERSSWIFNERAKSATKIFRTRGGARERERGWPHHSRDIFAGSSRKFLPASLRSSEQNSEQNRAAPSDARAPAGKSVGSIPKSILKDRESQHAPRVRILGRSRCPVWWGSANESVANDFTTVFEMPVARRNSYIIITRERTSIDIHSRFHLKTKPNRSDFRERVYRRGLASDVT